ncbi:MAG: isochorismatase family protein, partial [Acetobacteraceae bacterium]|nr:isochorismatase family protein [Acetobacteraceae bacterium]
IDFQERLVPAIDGGQAVVAQAQRLAQAARLLGVPVLATEQLPHRLGPTVAPLRDLPLAVIPKAEFDACRAANVRSALPPDRATIVLTGCEAHVCVLQTAFGLLEAGYRVAVARDAAGSRRPESKEAAVARLTQAGADIVTAEMVIFEWLGTANRPEFREVLPLIK